MSPAPLQENHCGVCGGAFAPDDLAVFGEVSVCGGCQPVFVQAYRQGMVEPVIRIDLRYAGFWIRVAAQLIDGVVLLMFGILLFVLASVVVSLAHLTLHEAEVVGGVFADASLPLICLYCFFFWTRTGATPGKMLCRIKVVDAEDLGPIRNGQALQRWFCEILSAIIVGIGFLMPLWSREKQTLHDNIARTRVICSR